MTYPNTAMTLTVELYYSADWHDISAYVYCRDYLTVTRGRSEPQSSLTQGSLTLTLDNRDGRFTPRHPTSPLYGLIGRGTPIRVVADGSNRFYGRVAEWPVVWDHDDVYVTITAGGPFRRLGQSGASSVKSAMRRGLEEFSSQIAYWPMEDGEYATRWASTIEGVDDLVPYIGGSTTPPAFASATNFECSDSLPVVHGRSDADLPYYDLSTLGEVQVRGLFTIPASAASTVLFDLYVDGTRDHYVLNYVTGGYLNVQIVDDTTYGWTTIETTANYDFGLDDTSAYITFSLQQVGTDIDWVIEMYEPNAPAVLTALDTFATPAYFYSTRKLRVGGVLMGATDGWSIGHVSVDNAAYAMSSFTSYVNAYAGETPRSRIERLALENGMSVSSSGTYGQAMGVQKIETVLELLGKSEDVSSGMLWESRYFLDTIAWTGRSVLHNQAPTATLSCAGASPTDLKPIDDDSLIVNDVTVTRDGGGQFRKVITSGPLGVDEISTYESGVTLSLFEDAQARDQAGWRAYVGTLDVARYPLITVNMANIALHSASEYSNCKSVDIGKVIQLEDIPVDIFPSDTIRVMVIGYSEQINQFEWSIDLVCLPFERYQSWEIDGTDYARLQPAGLTLADAAGVDTTDTTWSVASTSGTAPLIDTGGYAAQFPIPAMCEGEEISITAVTGISTTQAYTVTRSVNGIVKSHALGAVITLKYLNPIGL